MASTVLVNLRKDWFGPDGSLYQARDNPHEFPAEWAEPGEDIETKSARKSTTVEEKPAEVTKPKYAVLPSTAEIVDSDAKTVATIQNTGGGQRVMVPTAVEGDVSSIGGAVGDHGVEEPHQKVGEAAKVAKDVGVDQVGGKPRESGPLPAGTKKNV